MLFFIRYNRIVLFHATAYFIRISRPKLQKMLHFPWDIFLPPPQFRRAPQNHFHQTSFFNAFTFIKSIFGQNKNPTGSVFSTIQSTASSVLSLIRQRGIFAQYGATPLPVNGFRRSIVYNGSPILSLHTKRSCRKTKAEFLRQHRIKYVSSIQKRPQNFFRQQQYTRYPMKDQLIFIFLFLPKQRSSHPSPITYQIYSRNSPKLFHPVTRKRKKRNSHFYKTIKRFTPSG